MSNIEAAKPDTENDHRPEKAKLCKREEQRVSSLSNHEITANLG